MGWLADWVFCFVNWSVSVVCTFFVSLASLDCMSNRKMDTWGVPNVSLQVSLHVQQKSPWTRCAYGDTKGDRVRHRDSALRCWRRRCTVHYTRRVGSSQTKHNYNPFSMCTIAYLVNPLSECCTVKSAQPSTSSHAQPFQISPHLIHLPAHVTVHPRHLPHDLLFANTSTCFPVPCPPSPLSLLPSLPLLTLHTHTIRPQLPPCHPHPLCKPRLRIPQMRSIIRQRPCRLGRVYFFPRLSQHNLGLGLLPVRDERGLVRAELEGARHWAVLRFEGAQERGEDGVGLGLEEGGEGCGGGEAAKCELLGRGGQGLLEGGEVGWEKRDRAVDIGGVGGGVGDAGEVDG